CSTGTSDCETESTALGSLANSFHRRLRKNTIELATRKRISSAVALDPNTLAVTRLAATRGEPVTRSAAQTVSRERRRAAGKPPGNLLRKPEIHGINLTLSDQAVAEPLRKKTQRVL
ncbi:MAG TPA: hypothetical protein VI256_11590, partial [Roseiarcus sp.]